MNFCSGGVVEGTISAAEVSVPPRPAGIPESYIFDKDVQLWMNPASVSKANAVEEKAASASSGIEVISSVTQQSPYVSGGAGSALAMSNDPICFEYTNTGACGRLARGEICRYRHLEPTHPDVIADRVRQGKLPPAALEAALAGDEAKLKAVMSGGVAAAAANMPNLGLTASLMPGQTEEDLVDPGPSASLCFDYINNGSCTRLRTGQTCKYRHLPPTHPDVIADRIKQRKLTPQQAQAMIATGALTNPQGTVGTAAAAHILAGSTCGGGESLAGVGALGAAGNPFASALPGDPGPGHQLCFDYINRGMCSRLQRGENCRYRHLPQNHPDVIADKVKQGKTPTALPTPPMGNYVNTLAQLGASIHGVTGHGMMAMSHPMAAMMAPPASMLGTMPLVGQVAPGPIPGLTNPPTMTHVAVGRTTQRKQSSSSSSSRSRSPPRRRRDRSRSPRRRDRSRSPRRRDRRRDYSPPRRRRDRDRSPPRRRRDSSRSPRRRDDSRSPRRRKDSRSPRGRDRRSAERNRRSSPRDDRKSSHERNGDGAAAQATPGDGAADAAAANDDGDAVDAAARNA